VTTIQFLVQSFLQFFSGSLDRLLDRRPAMAHSNGLKTSKSSFHKTTLIVVTILGATVFVAYMYLDSGRSGTKLAHRMLDFGLNEVS
jgi:hypothetical protein